MKHFFITLFIVIIAISLFAQDDFGIPSILPKELTYGCHSAPPSGDNVLFNVDVIDTANDAGDVLPVTYSKIFISTNSQTSWTNYDMSLDGTFDYEDTYFYNWSPASDFYYYYQFSTDSTFSSLSPEYAGTGFPAANYWANIHDDPAGDDASITVEGDTYNWTNTDLRNFKMTYSDTRLYFEMTTQGGLDTNHEYFLRECGSLITWDQNVNFYHLYASPIINPEAPYPDSIFYAVIYGDMDVSFLGVGITITPGVYKIVKPGPDAGMSEYLDAYTKISSSTTFDHTISGNTLQMWFEKSILTSDPDFGDFPDDNGFVTGCGFVTAALWPKECGMYGVDVPDTFSFVVHDFSKNTAFYMQTPRDIVDDNTGFTLTDVGWSDLTSGFDISVTYTDPDDNCPVQRTLEIGGCYPGTYEMTTPDHKYDDGSVFTAAFTMPDVAKIPYRFTFDDGMTETVTAWDTINTGISLLDIAVNGAIEEHIYLDSMDIGETYITVESESLHIANIGTVPIDLGLRVTSITGSAATFEAGEDPTTNMFELTAILNDNTTPPLSADFDAGSNVIYSSATFMWSDGADTYGGGGINIPPECYNGDISAADVMSEKLWLRLQTPTWAEDMDGHEDLTIQIIVQARETLY
ncbi:MAG: hypothetical protein ACLFSQ_02490 [Candidatus Zixiibacteriota bacterium]